jgi:diguanylate cyclase (GGDEF)-like protein/PAS domain S-box-containing protein
MGSSPSVERIVDSKDKAMRRSRETGERTVEEMAVIAEIGRLISSTLNIDDVYERFTAEVRKLIDFDRLAVNLCNFQENTMRIAYVSGAVIDDRRQGDSLVLAGTLSEEIIRTRTGMLVQSENMDETVERFPPLVATFQAGLCSLMAIPLIYRNEAIGVLHFRSKKPNAYTGQDLRLAERIGGQIAGAIAAAQLYQELKETETSLRESESRFRAIFEKAAVGVAEIEIGTGRFLTVNRWFCELVGRTEEELLGTTFQAITHPDDLHRHEAKMALLVAGKIGSYELEKRYIRKDGAIVWVNLTISPLWKPEEAPTRNLIVVQDVTERRRIEEENERRARQLTVLHKTSVELTAELNLNALLQSIAQHALNLIGGIYCNCYLYRPEADLLDRVANAGKEMFPGGGTTRQRGEGLVGHVWEHGVPLLVDDYRSWPGRNKKYDSYPHPSRALVGAPIHWGDEFLGVLSVAAFLPHRYTQADMDMLAMFATQAAIAIRNARLYGMVEQLAVTDELTGLFNRRGFFQLGEREFERALRFNRPLAALMFDIDHFKRVNDTHGHPVGDKVLRALADCVRQNTRGIDVAGRYGGEEFVLVLPETPLPEAVQIAERLRQSITDLSVPICPANGDSPPAEIHITVSIGVAVALPGIRNLADLLEQADHAMYRGKDLGRNRVVVWEGMPDS